MALAARDSRGERVFDAVQATWNLLEQSAGEALLEAHRQGLSVIIKEGVANGRLTARGTMPHLKGRIETLAETAKRLGTTPDAVALAAVLAQPFSPMVLSGATTSEQLDQNLGAARGVAERLMSDPALLQTLLEQMRQAPQEYWADRGALAWN